MGGAAAGGGAGGPRDQRGGRQPHLEALLSRANEDRQDAESRLADVTKERDRLATKVKTLERDLATSRKAKPPAQAAQALEGPEGAEAPPDDSGGGGAVPPVSSTLWPAHRRGMRRPDVGSVHGPADGHDGQWPAGQCDERGLQRPQGECRTGGCAPAAPLPHRLTSAAISFVEAGAEQSSQGSASRSSAPEGGGVRSSPFNLRPHVPCNLHECYLYIYIHECMYKYPAPPPRHGQFDRRLGHSTPTLRIFLQHCLYFYSGYAMPPDLLHC